MTCTRFIKRQVLVTDWNRRTKRSRQDGKLIEVKPVQIEVEAFPDRNLTESTLHFATWIVWLDH